MTILPRALFLQIILDHTYYMLHQIISLLANLAENLWSTIAPISMHFNYRIAIISEFFLLQQVHKVMWPAQLFVYYIFYQALLDGIFS